jgi:hypothetical protein
LQLNQRGNLIALNSLSTDLILRNAANTLDVGSARIQSRLIAGRGDDVDIRITLANALPLAGRVFEGWLVDNNTGYRLSLGTFTLLGNGQATLSFRQNMVNFGAYDAIIVTEEALGDSNPNPSGIVVAQTGSTGSVSGNANEIRFRATLLGQNEVPATGSIATGDGDFILNTANNTLTFDIRIVNLSSQETAAHIHGPASPGVNGGVLFTLPLGNRKTGTWTYDQAMESSILAGQTYVNVHSINFPSGEIRGQLIP